MDIKEKMHSGKIYDSGDEELLKEQFGYMDLLHQFNMASPLEIEKKEKLLKELFAEIGEDCYITAPFYANWGGHHIHFGKGVYCNYAVTMVDDTHIYVGDYTEIGPNVTIATAGHPILPELRGNTAYQYNAPVKIGKNCWIGAGAVVLPGVTIGDNTVIGAGSVVTKDIPDNVVAVGNPCKVLRPIGDHDREYYFKDKKIDWNDFK
ncbi:MAG: sugar O-acetyltransferase [Eubacteriales bacterium]|nr:sugar O-acetyltransferase [Eubacteriales bacterium]